MLIINNQIVADLLTMEDCIKAQEEAFKKIPTGGAIHRPRIDMYVPCKRDDGYFRWGTMEGANDGYFAIRMKSDIMHWPEDENGNWTEEKYCREPGTYCGMILLISTENAEPLAFINDGMLQHMRVGGGAGIGVKYLAREDSHVVGMLGSGGMARTFLESFKSVRDIRQCKVYSPTPEHREEYAEEMSKRLNIEVIAVDTPQEAVKGADILSSCTDAMNPVYDAEWIEPGMHVTNLGRREMPDDSANHFDVVIRQGTAGLQMKQTERFQAERGLSPAAYIAGSEEEMKRIPEKNPQPGFGGDDPEFTDRGKGGDKPDFSDLVSGKAKGRTSPDDVTFYRNVGNQGLQFSSVGQVVYRLAKAQGLGQEIPTDWFLQDIRD
ncbi:MAG: ornithine cyclodeaminase family protein [Rhodospirillales bacterium]|jgi:alanine dehydrogenase|nr:ornithine cyclodeaminase family protein [Rhodospirillales bacterium]MBT4007124.1 ornithine cyclodeaminase family protein [Rhodospirillales bacterium]MBT5076928.1 ornithine cyclodeaminase family protein [Rhodospirillales bacterium]MBT5113457.1 ornithine cyclodeaminase family protein [Rhodospirillales bacterium]MBT5673755.1 ornithine cyclodeaminase family protein [Rhodospirillales bacterium]